MPYTIKVNGQERTVDVVEDTPLLWVIREELGLTGTKFGCGIAMCGACTVHLDGQPLRSCSIPVSGVSGEITTIEAVDGPDAKAVPAAWVAGAVPQCCSCPSGQIMTAVALLPALPQPSDEDINRAMSGNICRCGCYMRMRSAVRQAAKSLATTS